jgi:hypothetical protein
LVCCSGAGDEEESGEAGATERKRVRKVRKG